MSIRAEPLSELLQPFRRYADSGEINTEVPDPEAVGGRHDRARGGCRVGPLDLLDGLTADHGDWWYNVRPSNTEPLLRLNVEAATPDACRGHVDELVALVASSRIPTPRTAGDRPPKTARPKTARTDRSGGDMALDQLLIEVLACPADKQPLLFFDDEDRLYNPRLHRSYAVRDGIPVLLVDESTLVDEVEHARLMARAAAGDAVETGRPADRSGRPDRVSPGLSGGDDRPASPLPVDSLGLWDLAAGLPEQLAGAAAPVSLEPVPIGLTHLVLVGVGEAATAARAVAAMARSPGAPAGHSVVGRTDTRGSRTVEPGRGLVGLGGDRGDGGGDGDRRHAGATVLVACPARVVLLAEAAVGRPVGSSWRPDRPSGPCSAALTVAPLVALEALGVLEGVGPEVRRRRRLVRPGTGTPCSAPVGFRSRCPGASAGPSR